jgi:hypothetical protein
VQRGGVRQLRLDDVIGEVGNRKRRPDAARDRAVLDRIPPGLRQREHLVVDFEVWKVESADPGDGSERVVERAP